MSSASGAFHGFCATLYLLTPYHDPPVRFEDEDDDEDER
jgi:hypothetical protein